MAELKAAITEDMKTAMKAQDKVRLSAIRMIMASIKQIEVDERIELDDARIIALLDKMAKQRRESISQFAAAGREDLVAKETLELEVVLNYLPQPLTEAELEQLITTTIAELNVGNMQDMGKVINALKPQVQGRADMRLVSEKVKQRLA